jgi:flagellar motor switch protein FliN/FliY
MAKKTTVKNELTEDPLASSSLDLEHAIDDLRGALKADEDGMLLSADPFASPASDFGSDSFGSTDFGTSDFGTSDFGATDFGSDTGKSDFGSSSFGGGPSAMPSFGSDNHGENLEANHDLIMDIPIDVQIVLGASRMPVKGLMSLKEGTTITLDKKIGEPVDITVNGRLIARGEITLLEDDDTRFGVKLTELSGAPKS